jgi:propanol-preferring alcohol dehydrogenase
VIEEFPISAPQGRQLLVRIKAASLCQTDLMVVNGDLPVVFPVVPGHEAVSVVEEMGPDAGKFGIGIGDIVGATPFDSMCMVCTSCKHYGPDFCPKKQLLGITKAGYFAEYALIDAASTIVLSRAGEKSPAPVAALSPLLCAGITVWDAIERAKPNNSETFAIIGTGGLGAIAVRYLHSFGVKVIALDIRDAQLKTLEEAGIVDGVLNTKDLSSEQVTEKVLALNNGMLLDTVIVTSSAVQAYSSALQLLKPGGKLVVVGLPHNPIPLPAAAISGRVLR